RCMHGVFPEACARPQTPLRARIFPRLDERVTLLSRSRGTDMAFCPHCGKSVTDQASKCLACGKEFEPRAKGARFKATMMMSPGTAGAVPQRPVTPAAGTEQPAA